MSLIMACAIIKTRVTNISTDVSVRGEKNATWNRKRSARNLLNSNQFFLPMEKYQKSSKGKMISVESFCLNGKELINQSR